MESGISHLIAPQLSCIDFLNSARAAGYDVAEISIKNEGALTPDTPDAELQRIIDTSRDTQVPIVSVALNHCTGNLLAAGESQRIGIEETIAGLEIAHKLGASTVLHTLGRLSPDLYYDDAYNNAVAALQAIAEHCQRLNLRLAVEFIWNGFLFSPLEMRRFLEDVGRPHIGFYFDPGNMAVFQYPQHWARILGHHIFMVHVKDWKGRALNGSWTSLLEGEVDFPSVMRELRAGGYDGPLISEVSSELASFEHTAKQIRQIMAC